MEKEKIMLFLEYLKRKLDFMITLGILFGILFSFWHFYNYVNKLLNSRIVELESKQKRLEKELMEKDKQIKEYEEKLAEFRKRIEEMKFKPKKYSGDVKKLAVEFKNRGF